MTLTARRGIRRNGPTQAVLTALATSGGSMEWDEFRRVVADNYGTENSMSCAINQMRKRGLIQRRVFLTASGSARLSKTAPED